jgi:cobalamin biosynthetic protein CobC
MVSHAAKSMEHGGDLSAARRLFPDAPEPFVDLSTGINPYPYTTEALSPLLFERLPQPDALARLLAAATEAYGAPSPACIVAAPGTQILLPLVAALKPAGRAAILGPTYAEHARAAALCGHRVTEAQSLRELADADLAILVNPNNPDGRIIAAADLLALAGVLRSRDGLLVIDEAFMDVGPPTASLTSKVERGGLVVLRSFGKFFGLAGLRLGFAVAAADIAAKLRALLGPWAVSGPALAIGASALADRSWIEATRLRLAQSAQRLDGLLTGAGLEVVGGTPLFRLVQTPAAATLHETLGRAGILVRRFAEHPTWLRFGLPGDEPAWERLEKALARGRCR